MNVLRRRPVILFQAHKNIHITRANRSGVAVREVDAAVRQADGVDNAVNFLRRNLLPDGLLDQIRETRSLLDSRPGARSHMQFELPRVHRREKILPQPWKQEHYRNQAEAKKDQQKSPLMMQTAFQQSVVAFAEALESFFKPDLHRHQRISALALRQRLGFMPAQQIFRHGRYQRPRQKVRSQHGKHDRFRQRYKEKPRHAGQKKHGHEHDADGQRRNKGWNRDLLRAVENRVFNFFPLRQVAIDVLDFNGGVVDQNADRQCESTQRHDVDGLAQRAHHDDRGQNRKRNRNRNDDRAPPVTQKNQNHQSGETGGNGSFLNHAVNGCANEKRLVSQRIYVQLWGQARGNLWQQRLHAGNDVESRSLPALQHSQQNRPLPIHPHDIGLWRKPVPDIRHIANVDGGVPHRLDGQLIQFGNRTGGAVGINRILKRTDF